MFDPTYVDYIRDGLRHAVDDQLARGLISAKGASLVAKVIDSPGASDNDGISIGQIRMPMHGGVSLSRLFVIRGAADQYVLYVPEQPRSPGDRIFHESYDWRRIGHVLVGFLGKPGGLEYMLDLVAEDQRHHVAQYFKELSNLPSSWSEHAIATFPVSGPTYLHQIQQIIRR